MTLEYNEGNKKSYPKWLAVCVVMKITANV